MSMYLNVIVPAAFTLALFVFKKVMVAVFAVFATLNFIDFKELGVGLAVAVLIDATIIRALLVPSLMQMLGRWNWWAPAPLARLHRRFGVSENLPPAAGPSSPPAGAASPTPVEITR